MGLKEDDQAAQAVSTKPRVSLQDIEALIEFKHVVNGLRCITDGLLLSTIGAIGLGKLSIAFIVLKTGFTVVGTSAPVSAENYNQDLGERFAYESALKQLWAHQGYHLAMRLYEAPPNPVPANNEATKQS